MNHSPGIAEMSKAKNPQLAISTETWIHPRDCWLDSLQGNKEARTSVLRDVWQLNLRTGMALKASKVSGEGFWTFHSTLWNFTVSNNDPEPSWDIYILPQPVEELFSLTTFIDSEQGWWLVFIPGVNQRYHLMATCSVFSKLRLPWNWNR